ncbi:hypothetical protein ACVIGA_000624 [Bradyrhizobium sp. USDA 3240]
MTRSPPGQIASARPISYKEKHNRKVVGSNMRFCVVTVLALHFLFAVPGIALAQSANDIANIFGGLVRTGTRMAAQSAWEQIRPGELVCIDRNLHERGWSINGAIDQGIGPADPRVADARAVCRGARVEQSASVEGPSFDCSKAGFPDERLICSSVELSQLDNAVANGFRYARDHSGAAIADSIRGPSLQERRACGANFECVKRAQLAAIDAYRRSGAPDVAPRLRSTPTAHPEYVVDGLSLGAQINVSSPALQGYQCRPSEQFTGFVLCQRRREMREARGQYTSSNTLLYSLDGSAVYINRSLEPAFFGPNEAQADIDGRTKHFGRAPRIIPIPAQSNVPNGMIASWGDVVLEPLDSATLQDLAAGKRIRVGFMIDHIGNLRRSAQLGLPVYRLRGGAGYVWAACWNQNGVGTLQFLTVDASTFDSEPPQVASGPSAAPAKVDEPRPEDARRAAEKAASDKAAADKAATDKAAADKAAAEKVAAEKAAAQAAADEAARKAEVELARQAELRRRGEEYAAQGETKWTMTRTPNEMTDKVDVVVRSVQKNNQGLVIEVVGSCKNGEVGFSGLIVDDEGKATVRLVGRTSFGNGLGSGVPALYRVNDKQPSNVLVPELEFVNKLQLVIFARAAGKSETVETSARLVTALLGANIFVSPAETWRIMTELKTDRGSIIVKIPVFDPTIQALFQSCGP